VSGNVRLFDFVHIENVINLLYTHVVLIQKAAYPQEFKHGKENSHAEKQEHE
jgi:hypothetical protein